MQNTETQVLRFNTLSLLTTQDLLNAVKAIDFTKKKNPSCSLIILHGYYANSDSKIQKLAQESLRISRQVLETRFQNFQNTFLSALRSFSPLLKNKTAATDQLEQVSKNLHSLLLGIFAVKEISTKTLASILKYTSRLTSILVHTLIEEKAAPLSLSISTARKKMSRSYDVHIVPVENIDDGIDFLASNLAVQYKASCLSIWSNLEGLQTVDANIVPSAKPIKEIDYSTALEISCLGGSFLHPQALSLVQEKSVPISIHNQKNPSHPISYIKQDAKMPQNSCVAITYQKDCIMLTVRSPQMFHHHGYLEKIFAICTLCNVSVDTLTTSEITVTMTFRKKYFSQNFLRRLKKLGELEYSENQVLISIIGKNYWRNAAHSASLLQKLHPLAINMISLGQNSTNLGLVLDQKHLVPAIKKLHRILF